MDDDALKIIVGKQIKARREYLKTQAGPEWRLWTQDAVSERIGVDLTTYQRWESGERGMEFRSLVKLGTLFQVPVGYFFEPVDELILARRVPGEKNIKSQPQAFVDVAEISAQAFFEYVQKLEKDNVSMSESLKTAQHALLGSTKRSYQKPPKPKK